MTQAAPELAWRAPLLPYQQTGLLALLRQEAVLLADDMGLGKTIQAIAALRVLFARGEIQRALVVTPAGLLAQWRHELHQWAPELTALRIDGPPTERAWKWGAARQIFLIGYETLRGDAVRANAIPWDVVILDEAQKIKNRGAITSQVCKRLPRRRSWALTGTPLENCEDDLASLLEFVRPNPEGKRLPGLHAGLRLRGLHEELQLRRRKQDVLTDLPPKTLVRVPLELSREQMRSYQEAEQRGCQYLAGLGERATIINVLELITQLKQICNFCPTTGRSVKLDDLRERMARLDCSGHRALIFSQWTNDNWGVGRLARELAEFHPLAYTGSMDAAERSACVETFRNHPRHKALLLSLRAGGQGLNLQEASYVFHFDRWWNPAVENQATDRAHRLGQRNAVTVYAYTCLSTIEERIEQILERKRDLFAALVDQVSFDVRRLLTAAELFGLFGLALPARLRSHETLPAMRDTKERLMQLLQHSGWLRIRHLDDRSIEASREDEIGTQHLLHATCLDRWDDRVLDNTNGGWSLVVCPSGFPPSALDAARGLAIALLDEGALRQLEDALRIQPEASGEPARRQ